MKRGLLRLENVEDVGGVVGELVQRYPDLLLCPLHRDVNARHPPGASHSPSPSRLLGETLGRWVSASAGFQAAAVYTGGRAFKTGTVVKKMTFVFLDLET